MAAKKDNGDNILLEADEKGNQLAANTWGSKLVCRQAGAETMYYWYNGHGDVVALLDPFGVIVGMYTYDAFGVPQQCTDKNNNPYRYAGYLYDRESGLYYLRTRFYQAEIGRFIQRDTYAGDDQDPMSLNRYTYCQNEPVMYHDPVGQASVSIRDAYPNKILELDKKGKTIYGLWLTDKKTGKKDYLTYGKQFVVLNGISYGINNYENKFHISVKSIPPQVVNFRTLLGMNNYKNVQSFGGLGQMKITAVDPQGRNVMFREGYDFRIGTGEWAGRAYADIDKNQRVVAPPKIRHEPGDLTYGKTFEKEVTAVAFWNLGVYTGDKNYDVYRTLAEETTKSIIKGNYTELFIEAINSVIDVVSLAYGGAVAEKAVNYVGGAIGKRAAAKGGATVVGKESSKVATSIIEKGIQPSPKGLIGRDFEDYLTSTIGGKGSFKVGGREFDGAIGNRWWEAKSGQYWDMLLDNPKQLAKFKSDMGDRLRIATQNKATYELFSNTPIPESIKNWLTKKGIPYTEIIN